MNPTPRKQQVSFEIDEDLYVVKGAAVFFCVGEDNMSIVLYASLGETYAWDVVSLMNAGQKEAEKVMAQLPRRTSN